MNRIQKNRGKQIIFILLVGLFLLGPLLTNTSVELSRKSEEKSVQYTDTFHPCSALYIQSTFDGVAYIDENINIWVYPREYDGMVLSVDLTIYSPTLTEVDYIILTDNSGGLGISWTGSVNVEGWDINTTGNYNFSFGIFHIDSSPHLTTINYTRPVYVEPAFTVTPANNTMITGTEGDVPFILDVISPGLGASIAFDEVAQMKVNDTWFDMVDISDVSVPRSSFFIDVDLSNIDGNYTDDYNVEFNLTNSLGKTTNHNLTYIVDNIPPSIEFNHGLADGLHITEDFLLSVNTSDAESGIESVELQITEEFGVGTTHQVIELDNDTIWEYWDYLWVVNSGSWTEGNYSLEFTIINGAQLQTIITMIVTVDFTSPILNIISAINETVISGDFSVQVFLSDAISDLAKFNLTINNSTQVDLIHYPSTNSIYEYLLGTGDYSDGTLNLTFYAENKAGLNSTLPLQYIVDNSLPALNLEGNLLMNGTRNLDLESIDVSGFSRIAWKIDNSIYTELATAVNQTLVINSENYQDGYHNLTFYLADGASPANFQEFHFEIIVDNSNPQLSVQNLEEGDRLEFGYELIVEIFDATECELWISFDQGELIQVNGSLEENWYVVLRNYSLSSGLHHIALHAIDIVGNVDIDEYLFVYSTDVPLPWPLIRGIGGVLRFLV